MGNSQENTATESDASIELDAVKPVDNLQDRPDGNLSFSKKLQALEHLDNRKDCLNAESAPMGDRESPPSVKLEVAKPVDNLGGDTEAATALSDGQATLKSAVEELEMCDHVTEEQTDDHVTESFALEHYALRKNKVCQNVEMAEAHNSASRQEHSSSGSLVYMSDDYVKKSELYCRDSTNQDSRKSGNREKEVTSPENLSKIKKCLNEPVNSPNDFNYSTMFEESHESSWGSDLQMTGKCHLWRDRDLYYDESVATIRAQKAVSTPKDNISLSTRCLLDNSDKGSTMSPIEMNSFSMIVHDKSSQRIPDAQTSVNHDQSFSFSLSEKMGALDLMENVTTQELSKLVSEQPTRAEETSHIKDDSFYEQQEHTKADISRGFIGKNTSENDSTDYCVRIPNEDLVKLRVEIKEAIHPVEVSSSTVSDVEKSPAPSTVVGERSPAPPAVVGERSPAPPAVVGERSPAPPAVVGERSPAPPAVVGERSPAPAPVSKHVALKILSILPDSSIPTPPILPDSSIPTPPILPDRSIPTPPILPDSSIPIPPILPDSSIPTMSSGVDHDSGSEELVSVSPCSESIFFSDTENSDDEHGSNSTDVSTESHRLLDAVRRMLAHLSSGVESLLSSTSRFNSILDIRAKRRAVANLDLHPFLRLLDACGYEAAAPNSPKKETGDIDHETGAPDSPKNEAGDIDHETAAPDSPKNEAGDIDHETAAPDSPKNEAGDIDHETAAPDSPKNEAGDIDHETAAPDSPKNEAGDIDHETGEPDSPKNEAGDIDHEIDEPDSPKNEAGDIDHETGEPDSPKNEAGDIDHGTGEPDSPKNEFGDIVHETGASGSPKNECGDFDHETAALGSPKNETGEIGHETSALDSVKNESSGRRVVDVDIANSTLYGASSDTEILMSPQDLEKKMQLMFDRIISMESRIQNLTASPIVPLKKSPVCVVLSSDDEDTDQRTLDKSFSLEKRTNSRCQKRLQFERSRSVSFSEKVVLLHDDVVEIGLQDDAAGRCKYVPTPFRTSSTPSDGKQDPKRICLNADGKKGGLKTGEDVSPPAKDRVRIRVRPPTPSPKKDLLRSKQHRKVPPTERSVDALNDKGFPESSTSTEAVARLLIGEDEN